MDKDIQIKKLTEQRNMLLNALVDLCRGIKNINKPDGEFEVFDVHYVNAQKLFQESQINLLKTYSNLEHSFLLRNSYISYLS